MAAPKLIIESGAQLLARLTKKTEVKNFYPNLFNGGLKYGNTVEILSNVNTSHILADIISEAIYPSEMTENPIGVLMFNTGGNFIYDHLIKTLRNKIYTKCANNIKCKFQESEINKILDMTLSNLFLLDIYDATQFYTSIHNIEGILIKHTNISLIIFDSLTAFYWSEQGLKITKMDIYIKNLLRMIQNISKEYKVILVYTRPGYFSSNKDTDNLKANETSDDVSCKLQLLDNSKGDYQVNIKTLNTYYVKYFKIVDNVLKWQ